MALGDILVTINADISGYIDGLKQAENATRNFESSMKTSTSSVEHSSNAINDLGVDIKAADKAYDGYMQNTGASSLKVAGILQGVSTAITASIGILIKSASDFESAFVGVQKTVSATPAEFAELESEIRGLSKELPRSAVEIAEVAEEAGRLGIKQEDISQFTKTMIMMGDASDLSASQASQSMARLMNIMGTSQDDVEKLGSSITHMGNNAATSESEILEMSRRLAGSARQIDLTESELVGLSASMSELGIRAEAGGTAMQKTFLTMNSAVMSGGKELEAFAEVAGMSGDEFKQAFEQDASEAIVAFISGLDDVGESGEDVSGVLEDLGLNNERTRDTLLRLSSSHENLAENMDISGDAWEEGTALAEEAERRYDTLASQMTILWNRAKDVALIFGQSLMSAFSGVLSALEPLISAVELAAGWFETWPDWLKTTAGAIGLLIPVAISLTAALAALGGAAMLANTGLVTLVTGLGAVTTALGFLSGPVGWIALGLGAVASAVVGFMSGLNKASEAEEEFAEETENLTESTENLNDEINKSSAAYDESIKSAGESASKHRQLAEEVVNLSEQENKSAEDKSIISSRVEDLNSKVDGLNLAYDEQADSLSHSSDELKDRINFLKEEEKLSSSQERMVEIAEERNEAESKLGEINKHREKLNDLTESQGRISGDTREELGELNEQERELEETLRSLGAEQETVQEQIVTSQERVNEAIKEGVETQTLSYDQLGEEQQEMVDGMTDKYEELAESATDMFDKIPEKAEHSLSEMKETLEHNAETVGEWSDNLDELSERGANHLVEHFREAGPEHAAELEKIVNASDEEIGEMEENMEIGSENAAEATMAGLDIEEDVRDLVAGIVRGMADTFGFEVEEAGFNEYSKKAMEDAKGGIEGMQEELSEVSSAAAKNKVAEPFFGSLPLVDFYDHGEAIMQGHADGISENSGEPESAIGKANDLLKQRTTGDFDINSPSGVFFDYGQNLMEGLSGGIGNSEGGVLGTLGRVYDNMFGTTDRGLSDVEGRNTSGINTVDRIFGKLPGNTGNSMTEMLSKLRSKGASQTSYMATLPGKLKGPFDSFTSTLNSIASNAMAGFSRGISGATSGIVAKARGIASSVSGTLKSALKIKSPSRVLMDIGEDTVDGMSVGLSSKLKDIESMSQLLAQAATPEQPNLAKIDTGGLRNQSRKVSSRIQTDVQQGDFDTRREDNRLLAEIRDELRKQKDMIVELDGRAVGKTVEPYVSKSQDRKSNRRRKTPKGGLR